MRIRASAVLRRLGRYDRAVYRSVARLCTPLLDEPLRRVSGFANFSSHGSSRLASSPCSAGRMADVLRSQGSRL
jgi:hypothetical protein